MRQERIIRAGTNPRTGTPRTAAGHGVQAVVLAMAVAVAAVAPAHADSSGSERSHWVATWSSAPMDGATQTPPRVFENQTIRQVVHISAGGRRVRVRFSNAFGAQALRIGAAHVAFHAGGASIVPASDRALRFSGQPSITVPAGAVAVSDPVDLPVPSRADLAVSLYVPESTGPATFHEIANQTAYLSAPGDFTGATSLPVAETSPSRFWLNVVEVLAPENVGAVVALGDSITQGGRSTDDANHRWPDFLSARINPRFGPPRLAVVNQGIGCGRLLRDFCGPSGARRFDGDVLAVTGATHVVVALGLVDIIMPTAFGFPPDQFATSTDIIVGLRQLIARAHAEGLIIYGATITPVGSTPFPNVFTPENEAKRQAVNQWIRASGAFDGFIDFDAAVRDPGDPTRLRAVYDSDDGVHLSDAGYKAMADAIDLSLFRSRDGR